MRRFLQTVALVVLAAAALPASAASPANVLTAATPGPALSAPQNAAAMQSGKTFVPMPPALNIEILKICASDIPPPGWIKIGDEWNPTMCGSPAHEVLNQWTYARYETQPVGATLLACYGPVPNGWTVLGLYWNPYICGRPGVPTNNMMTLQRVN